MGVHLQPFPNRRFLVRVQLQLGTPCLECTHRLFRTKPHGAHAYQVVNVRSSCSRKWSRNSCSVFVLVLLCLGEMLTA